MCSPGKWAFPSIRWSRRLLVIERGFVQEVDLFEANGSPFVQMAGVGFDALVIEETSWESKKMLGPLAYLLAAVKVLGEKPPKLEVVCADGRREEGVAVLAGNGSLYGGPFKFFRNANNHDSKLDVLVYKEAGYRLVLDSLRGLAFGGIDLLASTSYFQTGGVRGPRRTGEVPVQVDGEWIGRFPEVHFVETRRTACGCSRRRMPLIGGFSDAVKSLLQWPRRAGRTPNHAHPVKRPAKVVLRRWLRRLGFFCARAASCCSLGWWRMRISRRSGHRAAGFSTRSRNCRRRRWAWCSARRTG